MRYRSAIWVIAMIVLLSDMAISLSAPKETFPWEFILLWQQPIEGGVAALAAGDLKGGSAPEIAVATWQNEIRVLSCTGERDSTFSAPPTTGNITLLAIGRGAKENFVAAAALWQPSVAAYGPDGRRLWIYEDPKGAGVAGLATLRWGIRDVIALAYTGKPAIRLLDEAGGVISTVNYLSNAFFAAGLDCDGDGIEETLSNPEKLQAEKTELVCFGPTGEYVKSIPFPGYTSLAITADVDNDGKKDIISYYGAESITLGVWSRSGKPLWTLKLKNRSAPWALAAADFDGDRRKEVAAAFPLGEIVIFKDGKRMAGALAQQRFPRIATADVDSDGRAELLVGDGKGLRAFKIAPRGKP